jgi:hypothetical protein
MEDPMLYTPHARVFLTAVPVYSGSAIASYVEVEDPTVAARAWEVAERDLQREERDEKVIDLEERRQNRMTRFMEFVRAQRAVA